MCDAEIPRGRFPEMLPQEGERLRFQICARLDPKRLHLRRGDGSDAVKFADRQRRDEGRAHLRGDDELAVGLALAGCELGEELVVGDTRRGGQAGLLQNARADRLCGRRGGRQAPPVLGHIEIGLIERERFDERGVFREDGVDLARDGAVDVEARRHEDQLRTLPHGRGRRHGRADAEGARLVARSGHDAALGAVADRDGLPRSSGLSRCSTDA